MMEFICIRDSQILGPVHSQLDFGGADGSNNFAQILLAFFIFEYGLLNIELFLFEVTTVITECKSCQSCMLSGEVCFILQLHVHV
jgi:hypothetical protein